MNSNAQDDQAAEARRLIAQQEKKRRIQSAQLRSHVDQKITQMKCISRWFPDSAITTLFGKPAFHAYGNGNMKPTAGGYLYGDYMKSHNINP